MAAMQSDADDAVKGMLAAVAQVGNGVGHTQEGERPVREIESGSQQTVAMVSDITSAIREQSAASSIIAQQQARIAQMSKENNAAAQNSAATESDLNEVAGTMRAEVSLYRV